MSHIDIGKKGKIQLNECAVNEEKEIKKKQSGDSSIATVFHQISVEIALSTKIKAAASFTTLRAQERQHRNGHMPTGSLTL